jgi:hypothetical protein
MARKKVPLGKFSAIIQALPDQLNQAAINGARKAAARLVVLVEYQIRNAQPFPLVDRGSLVQQTNLVLTPTGANVRNDAPHAAPQEYGSRPFSAPLQPLLEWAERKGFADPKAVAWAVRTKFLREGMKPKRFFAKALAQWKAEKALPRAIEESLARRKGGIP